MCGPEAMSEAVSATATFGPWYVALYAHIPSVQSYDFKHVSSSLLQEGRV